MAAVGDDGRLPQSYDANFVPDASALMVPVFGLLSRRDPVDGAALGNVPLVWSHGTGCALYLLDAARLRQRDRTAGLTLWRVARFASLRW